MKAVTDFIFLGCKITADSICSYENKRCSLLGRKDITNLHSVLFCSVSQSCPTLCDPTTATCQPSLSVTDPRGLLNLMYIELVMPFNHLILCFPLLLPPSVFLTIRVFSNESVLCIRWQKYWSFNFNISPSNEHSGLVSFRMEWLDLLAVEGTLKSLLHHHNSKASIFGSQLFL